MRIRDSAFLCDHFHKKHIVIPDIHKKSVPVYKPTPTAKPVSVYHSPVPEYKPPTPEHAHPTPTPTPTPIYHPPADHETQNPETEPEKFEKLLPFIKKNPFFFPKFSPGKDEIKA